MKKIFYKGAIALATVALLTNCSHDDDYGVPNLEGKCQTLAVTKQVSDITGAATATYQQYTADDVIEAYVTSSDQGGNFYKSITLMSVDGTKGFSMPADDYNLYTKYEPGRKVYVKLKDRYFVNQHSSTIIGSLYNNNTPDNPNDDSVGRMSRVEYPQTIIRSCDKVNEDEIVKHLTIAEAKSNQYLNMLIELDEVQFSSASNGKTYYDASLNSIGGATNHNITDLQGNTLIVRVSEYAQFAKNQTPTGSGKIRGVMTKFNNDFQFMIRTENDVQLGDPRIEAFFSQDFESIAATGNNQFVNLPGWSNVSLNGGAERWEARIFSGNKYAQLSAFGTGESNMDTWLITPAINLDATTGEFLMFGSKIGFANGEAVTVHISTNYSGAGTAAAINAATWTQLNPIMAPQTQSYPTDFTSSGPVDLSSYNGNVYIAFRYRGSATGITSTYQIDNIRVFGGN
ncbi:DUF5017 domain-containing protein [Flavobacterium sp. NST-5]|uniref:DUF5017 domain-containing protein n=1 Tax=Flavobacterium ichthyis TaxID=2698827 RepID=A0ABW9ZEA5_9FLAO|nr:DUF5689 domain-containing protein [Flavobacterium ichthyis]NBL65445.1 DUF5017 domain-containing protein [Flavobacterium ichthyis]